jgi:surfeit locus 1 family protein
VPTVLVTLAVAAMIALGLWQLLDRLPRKLAYLDQLRANPTRPAIPMPRTPDDTLLFRRTATICPAPVSVRLAGAGAAGFRAIATCRDGTIVQLGTTRDPNASPAWSGGAIAGYLSHAPDGRSLIETAIRRDPQALMLVATTPPTGLVANAPPDLDAVPNNHLAYAVQWFFFAAIAAIIYVLAVARRRR